MADFDEKSNGADSSLNNEPLDPGTDDNHPEKEWAPIRAQESCPAANRTGAGSKSTLIQSISRTRSQNGYGCDEVSDENGNVVDTEHGVAEKDPFEVGWENGDSDPLNPKSWRTAKKWLIVLICSLGSFCV
jgi:hypothetical protein